MAGSATPTGSPRFTRGRLRPPYDRPWARGRVDSATLWPGRPSGFERDRMTDRPPPRRGGHERGRKNGGSQVYTRPRSAAPAHNFGRRGSFLSRRELLEGNLSGRGDRLRRRRRGGVLVAKSLLRFAATPAPHRTRKVRMSVGVELCGLEETVVVCLWPLNETAARALRQPSGSWVFYFLCGDCAARDVHQVAEAAERKVSNERRKGWRSSERKPAVGSESGEALSTPKPKAIEVAERLGQGPTRSTTASARQSPPSERRMFASVAPRT